MKDPGLGSVLEELRKASNCVVENASQFETLIETGGIKSDTLSPFVPWSIYQSVINQTKVFQESGNLSNIRPYTDLMTMLRGFGRRWKQAGEICVLTSSKEDLYD
jgi:hypothetical protein